MKVEISYGCMSDSISKQIVKLNLKFDKKKISIFQKEADAINQLRFHSCLLSSSAASKLMQKLHNAVLKHLETANK